MPSTGTPSAARRCTSLSSRRARSSSIACGNAPTPGTTSADGLLEHIEVVGHPHVGAHALERLDDAAAVAHAVVADADHGSVTRSACPWCSGRRTRSGRSTTASRSARANALKAASIMWCAFVPASTRHVQRQLGRVGDRPEELLGQLVVEAARRSGRQRRLERDERAPADVDRAGCARLVHRHDGVAVAADPRAVAERRGPAPGPSDRPVSSTVWCAPVSRSPVTATSRSSRP